MVKKLDTQKEIDEAIENTRIAYQGAGIAYNSLSAPFQSAVIYPKIIAVIEEFLGSFSGKEILDVGCGAGNLIQMLNEQGAKCSGIDVAPVFVELACSNGLDVREASMHELPFSDEVFDAVVSNYALNYLPAEGQKLALREKFRVLRPGGIMIFSYMHPFLMRSNSPQPELSDRAIEDYFHPKRIETVEFIDQKFILHLLDWPEIVNMVIECGFDIRRLIDAEVPKNLDDIAKGIKNERVIQFVKSFRYNPYAMFVVATKGRGGKP